MVELAVRTNERGCEEPEEGICGSRNGSVDSFLGVADCCTKLPKSFSLEVSNAFSFRDLFFDVDEGEQEMLEDEA